MKSEWNFLSTDYPSSQVKSFWSALLYINPWPNRQSLMGLETLHAGWCHTSLHDPIRNVVSIMVLIVHWSMLIRCQINLRRTSKYLAYCYQVLVRVNPSFLQIWFCSWAQPYLYIVSVYNTFSDWSEQGHKSSKMSTLTRWRNR